MLGHFPTIIPQRQPSQKSSVPCDPTDDANSAHLVRRYQGLIVWRPQDAGPVEAAAVPTEAERGALLNRKETLRRNLLPAADSPDGVSRVAAAVATMLGGGYSSLTNVDRKTTIAGYTEALQDLPAWSVERGCDAVRKGKVPELDPDWPPTHARMHQISEKELAPVIAERVTIDGVLALKGPELVDEESQARMNAAAKAWLDRTDPACQQVAAGKRDIAGKTEARTLQEAADISERILLREYAAAGIEPMRDKYGMLISLPLARLLYPKKDEGEVAA